MSKESSARQKWAREYLKRSEHPFAEETLEAVGEVEGITRRLSDGRLVTTAEMTNEITEGIVGLILGTRKTQRRRLSLVASHEDKEKPDPADK